MRQTLYDTGVTSATSNQKSSLRFKVGMRKRHRRRHAHLRRLA